MADQTEDLSDVEDEILQQLQEIRRLKEQKQRQQTNMIDSDEEEDPRNVNDAGQQPRYFKKASKNEKILKRRMINERDERTSNGAGNMPFAQRMEMNRHRVKEAEQQQRALTERLQADGVYSFDLGEEKFKPINEKVNEKDKYSGKYLSKRYIPKKLLDKTLKGMKLMRLDNVFADIAPPKFQPPTCSNFVVIGIVVSKTEAVNNGKKRSKYMKVRLSDFRQQVTLSLFDKAFERYWKLRIGDVVAVLNPHVWPYKSSEGSGFTLFLKEDTTSLIEVGHARDFGFCKSIKKDGTRCTVPIDTSKGEYCEYHVELHFRKTASQRVELGKNVQMFAPSKNGVKEVMYAGKGQGSNSGGKDRVVDDTITANLLGLREENSFSTPEASRAFFNAHYRNPNAPEEKELVELKNAGARKEKKLRRKLSKLPGGGLLHGQDIETSSERRKRTTVTRQAFPPKRLTEIGFDPTRRLFEQKKEFNKKMATQRTQDLVTELKREGSKGYKRLLPSKEYVKRQRQEKASVLKFYEEKKNGTRGTKSATLAVIELSDGDDEFDDDYGSGPNKFLELKRKAGQKLGNR